MIGDEDKQGISTTAQHKMSLNKNEASKSIPQFECHSEPTMLGP